MVAVALARDEVFLAYLCVKHVHDHTGIEKDGALLSVLKKLEEQIAKSETPYDAIIELDDRELSCIDAAIHLGMADAVIAAKYGPMADHALGSGKLSQLAPLVPKLREVLRRIDLEQRLFLQEQRISSIETLLAGPNEADPAPSGKDVDASPIRQP